VKGNVYAKPPQPTLSEREKRIINLLIEDGSGASDKCIADFLCNCYPGDNNHARTSSGIGKYRRRVIEGINNIMAIVSYG
jgi:hypothetical protein